MTNLPKTGAMEQRTPPWTKCQSTANNNKETKSETRVFRVMNVTKYTVATSNIHSLNSVPKPAEGDWTLCDAHWIKSSRGDRSWNRVNSCPESIRARQGSLQSPKYPETGPGCPGRLLRPSPQRHRPRCVPNRPHQPPASSSRPESFASDAPSHARKGGKKVASSFKEGEMWKAFQRRGRFAHGDNWRSIFTHVRFFPPPLQIKSLSLDRFSVNLKLEYLIVTILSWQIINSKSLKWHNCGCAWTFHVSLKCRSRWNETNRVQA